MAKRLIPLLDRVLVEKVVAPTKSQGGILLPETASGNKMVLNAQVNSGIVIATGPGSRSRDGGVVPVSVKEGDTVLLPEYGGTAVKLGEKEFVLYRDDDILGVLEN